MSGPDFAALRALYRGGDDALIASQRRQLVDLGDGLAAQFADLERDLTPERAERLLGNLAAVSEHVRRLIALEVGR